MSILARLYQLKLEKQGLVDELLLFMPLYIYVFLTVTFTGRTGANASASY